MQNLLFFHFTFINIDILLLPQVRINALNTLYQFPLSDELTSKNSDGIRKGLLAALADEDEQLAVCLNLCFQDKLLKCHRSSHNCIVVQEISTLFRGVFLYLSPHLNVFVHRRGMETSWNCTFLYYCHLTKFCLSCHDICFIFFDLANG